jgi:hypothetical protein
VKIVTRFALFVLIAAIGPASALRAVTIVPTINGNELTGRIELAGGVAADLTITFEQVVGLTPTSLTINANLVDPADPTLLSRLPAGASLPAGFPVLLDISPPPSSTLSFSGVYKLSLYTHNLTLTAPLRIFRAPSSGGAFTDMTGFLEVGSVRAGGSGPGYSQFLIVLDPRALDPVIVAKFDGLQGILTANAGAMPPTVAAALQQQLTNARNLYNSGDLTGAIQGVAAFAQSVKDQSGTAIPNVWQANNPSVVNVAGLLRAAADTLKFTLTLKSNIGP